ncbi:AmmeMemoRadiSam system protein B [Oceanidesulfovibrio indonesiensis]|uniref:MEMO1 family protein DPQ33_05135 n=1 Tax=Oceanidesulfovibrio indonesiensis TaxID=54767 RepID=A0A7M3MIE6_9BACT|nr:AmmeMemoRadiSam system protein B [Oceanidesulfovibrio indonesiensis]TVM18963.1 AmmeMemoRadiSam system protein B [Oceanidesulfovibrio indonesiensis]
MDRKPIVAGRFYDDDPRRLYAQVDSYLDAAGPMETERTLLAMAPHAGYVYSGRVAGMTLGRANLASTLVLLGPNHTGNGLPMAVWPRGKWLVPGGGIAVDEKLAAAILGVDPHFQDDRAAHLYEHSLEVMAPFLKALGERRGTDYSIVPIAVAETRFDALQDAGRALGRLLQSWDTPVSILVSSDMSHYVSRERAETLDRMALDAVQALDARALFETVRSRGITMCGVYPMSLGLTAAAEMGAKQAEIVEYATSGDVSGDYEQVVGYAGVIVR